MSYVPKAPSLGPESKQLLDTFSDGPTVGRSAQINMPNLKPTREAISDREEFEEFAMDTYEWISMMRIQSPRIEVANNVDAYVSSYEVPCQHGAVETTSVCKVSWQGFLSPYWVQDTLMRLFMSVPSKSWLAFTSGAISNCSKADNSEVTVLRPPNSPGEYVMWEIRDVNSD